MTNKKLKFKTVTSGSSYNHNHMSQGKNIVVFEGVECPLCKHTFMPKLAAGPFPCPRCGFEETDQQERS